MFREVYAVFAHVQKGFNLSTRICSIGCFLSQSIAAALYFPSLAAVRPLSFFRFDLNFPVYLLVLFGLGGNSPFFPLLKLPRFRINLLLLLNATFF